MRSKAQDWAMPGKASTSVQLVGNNTNCTPSGSNSSDEPNERRPLQGLMDDYASPTEAARELHKHPFTLKRWRRAGYRRTSR
jgi:hypothetical protein